MRLFLFIFVFSQLLNSLVVFAEKVKKDFRESNSIKWEKVKEKSLNNPKKILWSFGFYTSHSVGFFIKSKSQKKLGYYNTKYKYSADYDLFYKMIVKKKMFGIATKKNEIFGKFRQGGLSSRIKYLDFLKENNRIRINNGQNILFVYLIFVLRLLRNFKNLFR